MITQQRVPKREFINFNFLLNHMTTHGNLLFVINFNNISTLHDHWNIELKPPRNVKLQRYSEDIFKIENNELVIMTIKEDLLKWGKIPRLFITLEP